MDFNRFVSRSNHSFVAFDPVAISLGPFDIHWYGIMYLLAFLFFWAGGNWLAKNREWWGWSQQDVGDTISGFSIVRSELVGGKRQIHLLQLVLLWDSTGLI